MRRRSARDNRPRWNDPDLRVYLRMNGDPAPAHIVQTIARYSFEKSINPHWRNDPTYNLRRRKESWGESSS